MAPGAPEGLENHVNSRSGGAWVTLKLVWCWALGATSLSLAPTQQPPSLATWYYCLHLAKSLILFWVTSSFQSWHQSPAARKARKATSSPTKNLFPWWGENAVLATEKCVYVVFPVSVCVITCWWCITLALEASLWIWWLVTTASKSTPYPNVLLVLCVCSQGVACREQTLPASHTPSS